MSNHDFEFDPDTEYEVEETARQYAGIQDPKAAVLWTVFQRLELLAKAEDRKVDDLIGDVLEATAHRQFQRLSDFSRKLHEHNTKASAYRWAMLDIRTALNLPEPAKDEEAVLAYHAWNDEDLEDPFPYCDGPTFCDNEHLAGSSRCAEHPDE